MIKELMKKTGRRRGKRWLIALAILLLVAGYCAWAARRQLPDIAAAQPLVSVKAEVPAGRPLAWPAGGQAAVGIAGSSTLQTHGGAQTGMPTASTAKLITALCVLQKRPLTLGQQGPTITLTASDVALFNSYNSKQGSVVKVAAGEQISEYQMLQTLMLPSANNMADSLATWAFGSLPAYAAYANNYVSQLNLTATHIGTDASGFDPSTVSSAHDLVKLGEIAMQNPVLAQIVGQPSASGIPIVNNIKNVNFLLGTDGIVGIKTGNTDQAGGVFVAADQGIINSKHVTIVTAVLGSPTLFAAMKDNLTLIQSAQANFKPATIVKADAVVGRYKLPWGNYVSAQATQDLKLSGWAGSTIPFTVNLKPISADSRSGQNIGSLTVKASATNGQTSIPLQLKTAPGKPSIRWRLLHPL